MSDHTPNTVGVDISKAHLDAHAPPSGRAERFANNAAGIRKLAAGAGPAECVVYESTEPWHRALEEALAGAAKAPIVARYGVSRTNPAGAPASAWLFTRG